MLVLLLFTLLLTLNNVNACADFILVLKSSNSNDTNIATRGFASKLVENLELDGNLHRLAVVSNNDVVIDFNQTKSIFTARKYLDFWPLTSESSSISLESQLLKVLDNGLKQRRKQIPLIIVLVDSDGMSSFSTDPALYGKFADKIKGKHYIHVVIGSEKAETLAIALEVLESAILAHNSNEMSDYLEPFYRCEAKFSKNNEVRRRPLPKLNEATAIPEIKSTKRRLIETTPVTTTTTTISTTTTKRTRKFGCQFDILTLIDTSSNAISSLDSVKKFISDIVNRIEIGEHSARFNVVQFAGNNRDFSVVNFVDEDKERILNQISTFEPLRGTRKIGAAITHAVQNWNEAENGKSRQKFLILFTNGYSNEDLSSASALLQKNNIRTFIVPTAILHPNSNIEPEYSQLKEIVSGKDLITDQKDFQRIYDAIIPARCK